MNLESPKVRWIIALALTGIGVAWRQHGEIEALQRQTYTAEAADLRAWRMSVEQALRNCKP